MVDFVWHDVTENTLIHLVKGQINAFQFTEDIEGFIIVFTNAFLQEQIGKLPNNEIIRLFNPHLFSSVLKIPKQSEVKTYIEMFQNRSICSNHIV